MSQPSTFNISDTITVVSEFVDAYNDAEQYGPEIGWMLLEHITNGLEAIQTINPTFFTSEELGWIQELLTQINSINSIDSTTQEGEHNES